ISPFNGGQAGFKLLREEIERFCGHGIPLRVAITGTIGDRWDCEVECIRNADVNLLTRMPSIFSFRQRKSERTSAVNAVMLIPTGTDCAIGGHAGDATPVARLLGSLCDNLVVHPNVVNASDINEQSESCLYVEGSLISRLLMGTISLRKVRQNRILVVTEARNDGPWAIDQVVNSTSAARATLGINCTNVVVLKQGMSMTIGRSPSGRSIGEIGGFETLFELLEKMRSSYD